MDTSDQGLSHTFKSHRAFANILTGIKNAFGMCQFLIAAACTRILNIPRDKNPKDLGPSNVGAAP
jgi:hypothetical protein